MSNQNNAAPMGAEPEIDPAERERRTVLANLLRRQASTPIDPNRQIGGVAYGINPLEGLNKLAQGYLAGQLDRENAASRPKANSPSGVVPALPMPATASPQSSMPPPEPVPPRG